MIKFSSSQHNFWTIVLKRIRRRHKRLKFVLKWFVFYNGISVCAVRSLSRFPQQYASRGRPRAVRWSPCSKF